MSQTPTVNDALQYMVGLNESESFGHLIEEPAPLRAKFAPAIGAKLARLATDPKYEVEPFFQLSRFSAFVPL
jgi:hypothetical protein